MNSFSTIKANIQNSVKQKKWLRIQGVFAIVMAFVTVSLLILPAFAMETTVYCGCQEHTHGVKCFETQEKTIDEELPSEKGAETESAEKILSCTLEEHHHEKICYSDAMADVENESVWQKMFADIPSTDNWRTNLVAVAESQIGYEESVRNYTFDENSEQRGYSRYGAWHGDAYCAWSEAFVLFCMNYAGVSAETMPQGINAEEWIAEAVEEKQFLEANQTPPLQGDVVFLDENDDQKVDSVGIVIKAAADEGEAADGVQVAIGDVENRVVKQSYSLTDKRILGYRQVPLSEKEEPQENVDAMLPEQAAPQENVDAMLPEQAAPVEPSTVFSAPSANPSEAWIPAESLQAGETYAIIFNSQSAVGRGTGTSLTALSVSPGNEEITVNGQTYTQYVSAIPQEAQWTTDGQYFEYGTQKLVYDMLAFDSSGQFLCQESSALGGAGSVTAATYQNPQIRVPAPNGYFYMQETGANITTQSDFATSYQLFRKVDKEDEPIEVCSISNTENGTAGGGGTSSEAITQKKTIDAFRDNELNPDSTLNGVTDLTDFYRIYLDAIAPESSAATPVDVIMVVDQSGSMEVEDMSYTDARGFQSRRPRWEVVNLMLNGKVNRTDAQYKKGLIQTVLDMNPNNRVAVTSFYGVKSYSQPYNYKKDSDLLLDWASTAPRFLNAKAKYNSGTHYEAGLLHTAELLSNSPTTNKKMVIFLSDGVPTYFINDKGVRRGNGNRDDAGNRALCKEGSKIAFDDFKRQFPNVPVYSIGVSKDINGVGENQSPEVLKYMSRNSGGKYYGVTDGEGLENAIRDILGLDVNQYKKLTITDQLSAEVEVYGEQPDYKVTKTDPAGNITVLYENGKITSQGVGKLKNVIYTPNQSTTSTGIVSAIFEDEYILESKCTYTLSYNAKTTETAYKKYAQNGYGGVTGDVGTDYGGNTTSSAKPGFHSNQSAGITYYKDTTECTSPFNHPVIQVVGCEMTLKKVSMNQENVTLAGAEFDLYRKANSGETGVILEGQEGTFVKINSESIITDASGIVKIEQLVPNTYYLVETKAPDGYVSFAGAQKIVLTRTTVNGPDGSSWIVGSSSDTTLVVKNSTGFVLPNTGGFGIRLYAVIGILLITLTLLFSACKAWGTVKEKGGNIK